MAAAAVVAESSQRARSWCFTLNNPPAGAPFAWDANGMVYLIYQLERAPTTQTLHYQGYLVWKNPQTLKKCRSLNGSIHWAIARGNAKQNTDYCSKEPREAPTVTHGVMPEQGKGAPLP